MQSRRHKIVPRALRCCTREHRRLDLGEALGVEEVPDRRDDDVSKSQVLLHRGTTKVDVPVLEAQHLVDLVFVASVFVDLERRSLGARQDLQTAAHYLDITGGQVGVGRALFTSAHLAVDLDAELAPKLLGERVALGRLGRVENDLNDSGHVPQVDEDQSAVVAARVHPSAEGHTLAFVVAPQIAAPVCPDHSRTRPSRSPAGMVD